jgi:hypothetical protein
MADEKYGIAKNYNSDLIKEYLNYSDSAIEKQRQAGRDSLNQSTGAMYDALGRMQLQTERDIAKRRTQAQRSGMTSSQLAAYEMQNIMTGQLGAQQIAQQYRQEQSMMESQFAGAEDQTRAALFELLNNNNAQIAAVDAQRYAASAYAQVKELFPGADAETQDMLARRMLGQELEPNEEKIVNSYLRSVSDGTASSRGGSAEGNNSATPKPVDFTEFNGDVLQYDKYILEYNQKHGTKYGVVKAQGRPPKLVEN